MRKRGLNPKIEKWRKLLPPPPYDYEIHEGRAFLILWRDQDEYGCPCAPCPFCGKRHQHGKGDGHCARHCPRDESLEFVIAGDGTEIRRDNGYFVRLRSSGSRTRTNDLKRD
jgi:hypothetical protein